MEKEEIQEKVKNLHLIQAWNHNFILKGGIETRPGEQTSHGKNLIKWQRIHPILEVVGLKNKIILDVGCNEGFFSIKLADMGAKVLGIDIDEHRIEKALFVKEVLNNSKVDFSLMDIYSEEFSALKKFDICLCLGVLHRVPDPYSVILKLTEHADIIIFEWKALKFGPHDEPFAYYTPGGYNDADYYGTQYWMMSFTCVEAILKRLGYMHFYKIDDPSFRRAILVAGRVYNPVFDLPDIILHRNRLKTFLSHTKRYIISVTKILKGSINT